MRPLVPALLLAACSGSPSLDARRQAVVNALAEDNLPWARREPALVRMKLAKMQRSPYAWLRGTAGLYWRDLTTPGTGRALAVAGDAPSSRVLLVGDPHVENIGTFRAPDGAMVVDWNDLDGAGYGPFEGDLRRLAAALIVAAGGPDLAPDVAADLARQAAVGYAAAIADLAAGRSVPPVGAGAEPLFDRLIAKARAKGDAGETLDEVAPLTAAGREVPFGDLSPVADDGVIEKRLAPVGAAAAVIIDRAIAAWRPTALVPLAPADAQVKLRMRRLGAGVASYAAWRFYVVLEGATPAPGDDLVLELKEERDGLVIPGVPRLSAAPWPSPAARVVSAQRQLHARADADALLGAAEAGGLSLRVREETAYQRGLSAADIADLAAGGADDAEALRALARRLGAMLGRAHGGALTADGGPGWTVIAPRLGADVADQLAPLAVADAASIVEDYRALAGVDLGAYVIPELGR